MSLISIKTLSNDANLHELSGYIQSIYLVVYPDKLLLLDGCCRADISLLRQYIEHQLNRCFKQLTAVVVTHMHPDHAGGAHKLRAITGCKIYAADIGGQWYSGIDGKLMHLTDIALARWVAKRKKKPIKHLWYSPKLTPDVKVSNKARLPGFDDWQVVYTQGHTDRDISLLHIPSDKIYVADLIVVVKGRYIPPFPLFYPNRYRASLMEIKALNSNSLLLAHGGEVSLSEADYQHLFNCAPRIPLTHWRSVKIKLKKVLFSR